MNGLRCFTGAASPVKPVSWGFVFFKKSKAFLALKKKIKKGGQIVTLFLATVVLGRQGVQVWG